MGERVCEGECVRERKRGRIERERTCRTDCSSFPLLSLHAHSPQWSCDIVAPSVGALSKGFLQSMLRQ